MGKNTLNFIFVGSLLSIIVELFYFNFSIMQVLLLNVGIIAIIIIILKPYYGIVFSIFYSYVLVYVKYLFEIERFGWGWMGLILIVLFSGILAALHRGKNIFKGINPNNVFFYYNLWVLTI
jgi:hypothetical protein